MSPSDLSARESAKIFLVMTGLILLPILIIPHSFAADPGTLDANFNGSGVAKTSFWSGGVGTSLAVQTDGKIVVVGYTFNNRFALARYDTTGILDTTFGPNSNGTMTTLVGTSSFAYGVAIQGDGKIVVAGTADGKIALARYNYSGLLDATFNSGGSQPGVVTTPIGTGAFAGGVAIQSDGKILVAGFTHIAGVGNFVLARYTSSGVMDSGFGSSGIQTTLIGTGAFAGGVAIQGDGKIVAAGNAIVSGVNNFAVARYTGSGVLDTTFGPNSNGTTTTSIGTRSHALGVAIQGDGKIVAAGDTVGSGVQSFAVARYTGSGLLDATFGPNVNGTLTTTIGVGAVANGVAIQSDGKIVAAGYAGLSTENFVLARYNTGGLLDATFNSGGSQPGVVTTLIGTSALANGVAIQGDGKLVAAGYAFPGPSFALARYLGVDVTPPTWPAGSTLTAKIINSSTVLLSWTAATDDFGVTSYKVYQGTTLIVSLLGSDYTYYVSHLRTGTTYIFSVQALDAANNTSTNGPSTSVRIPTTTSPTIVEPTTFSILVAGMTAVVAVSKRNKKPTDFGTPS